MIAEAVFDGAYHRALRGIKSSAFGYGFLNCLHREVFSEPSFGEKHFDSVTDTTTRNLSLILVKQVHIQNNLTSTQQLILLIGHS